jgi:hypothetical protein
VLRYYGFAWRFPGGDFPLYTRIGSLDDKISGTFQISALEMSSI